MLTFGLQAFDFRDSVSLWFLYLVYLLNQLDSWDCLFASDIMKTAFRS